MVRVADAGADTSRAAMDLVVDRLRAMSAREKLDVVAGLNRGCDQLSESGVRRRHPGACDDDVHRRVVALRLGRDLMGAVYDWHPDIEGW